MELLTVAIPRLEEDSIYGPRTAEAVRIWQRIAGLDPTGAVASYTWASLSDAYRALEEGKYGAEGQFGGVLGIAAGEADGEGRG